MYTRIMGIDEEVTAMDEFIHGHTRMSDEDLDVCDVVIEFYSNATSFSNLDEI